MFPSIIVKKLTDVGIEINGPHDWDPQVHDERFYNVLMSKEDDARTQPRAVMRYRSAWEFRFSVA